MLDLVQSVLQLIEFLVEILNVQVVELIAVPEVKLRMQVFNNWTKEITELLVSFLVSGHYSNLNVGHLNSAFDTHLDVSALARVLFLHV